MMTVTEIEQALIYANKYIPTEAIEDAIIQQEAITPILLDSLAYANKKGYSIKRKYMLHIYAICIRVIENYVFMMEAMGKKVEKRE